MKICLVVSYQGLSLHCCCRLSWSGQRTAGQLRQKGTSWAVVFFPGSLLSAATCVGDEVTETALLAAQQPVMGIVLFEAEQICPDSIHTKCRWNS